MAEGAVDPFDPAHLFGHVQDTTFFELPRALGGHVEVPQPLMRPEPIWQLQTGIGMLDRLVEPLELKLTRFMILEVVVAVIVCVVFIRMAQVMKQSDRPPGRFWNLLETMIVFIRDQVARPAIGRHDADRFLPFLLTMFFFVLGCNLFGMLPWTGTATASLATTGALAFMTFATVVASGMMKLGLVGFWKAQVPHMDLPLVLAIFLLPMIFLIEVIGILIKHFVLAVRLLANMLAGHLVVATILAFITLAARQEEVLMGLLVWGVAPASILGAVLIGLLELFVAFLQAYIFAFLSALFIGMAVHPH